MFTAILYEVKDRIATITLNRPEFANAFSADSYREVGEALDTAGKDDNVAAIVITGAGKNFSAGGDINRFRKLIDSKEYLQESGVTSAGKMSRAVRRCPKPVIAMVNGAAAGAGCGLALACDFRVVTAKSKLIMSFINLGLTGDTGCMYYLTKLIGLGRASEYMMTGDPLTGDKAYEYGAATVLAEEDKLEEAAYAYAAKMASKATFGLARQKEMINDFFYPELDAFIFREAENMVRASKTEDFDEAVTAFQAKRKPVFKGR